MEGLPKKRRGVPSPPAGVSRHANSQTSRTRDRGKAVARMGKHHGHDPIHEAQVQVMELYLTPAAMPREEIIFHEGPREDLVFALGLEDEEVRQGGQVRLGGPGK